jgi:Tannase and feruloyl esterase
MKSVTMMLAGCAAAALGLAAPMAAHAETACADLMKTTLPHAEVTKAVSEAVGDKQVCKVQVTSRPTKDSDIRLELWIPEGAAWNGKFVQLGNGGFAGQIPVVQFGRVVRAGYAVSGTDDGHQSKVVTQADWALGHPEKITDFGWRAVKETTDISKTLIKAQKGGGPQKSYFNGCSDGGREALMSAQRFPNDFDGIVAGAPAAYMSQLFGISSVQQQAMSKPGGYLGAPQRELLQKASIAQCSPGEAFIRDPASCHFDPAKLACKAGQMEGCLTPAQVASAEAMYTGRKDAKGNIAFPGFSPGAEAQNGAWNAWLTGQTDDGRSHAMGYAFTSDALKYFAYQDANFDFLKMDMITQYPIAQKKMAAEIDAPNPNLTAFEKHGGKLIQYHGWNDPAIPPRSSIRYYEDVRKTMGNTDSFYRMYLIPGMLHCAGGAGPSNVDWLAELDGWVTAGKAPGELTAMGGPGQAPGGPPSQTLCPYPGVAKKAGESWACSVAKTKG